MGDPDAKPRLWYLTEIIARLRSNEVFSPTAAQESSYKEALANVARIISNDADELRCRTCRSGMGAAGTKPKKRKPSRKECLKKILRVLHAMERKRIYDPPGDAEIGYYLVIRKYIRSFLTFFASETQPDFRENSTTFALMKELHHVEELAELHRHLASFAASISEMNIKNGYTPLMGIKHTNEVPPVIPGSRDRNSAFYCHKFILAYFDLRSHTLLFCSPPSAEEQITYLRAVDSTPLYPDQGMHIVTFSEEEDVYSDYLRFQLIERMEEDINGLKKHCTSIISAILSKLDVNEPWEILFSRRTFEIETVEAVSRDMVEKCKVSLKDLPAYIMYVEQGIRLARQTNTLLSGRFFYNENFLTSFLYNAVERPFRRSPLHQGSFKQGWVALHALTLLNSGSIDKFGEHSVFYNPMAQEREHATATERSEQGENVKILQGIIDDFRFIGDSDVVPDEEETQFLHKLWQSVSSAVQLFICALAYEQQQCVVKGKSLSADTVNFINSLRTLMHGLRSATERENDLISLKNLFERLDEVGDELEYLCEILHAYKEGLFEKVKAAQEPGCRCSYLL